MGSGAEYRARAMEIMLQAERASDDAIRSELFNIAAVYARLADHAERAGNYFVRVVPEDHPPMQ